MRKITGENENDRQTESKEGFAFPLPAWCGRTHRTASPAHHRTHYRERRKGKEREEREGREKILLCWKDKEGKKETYNPFCNKIPSFFF
mmetsp:Transcript_1725/g.4434  ORF Transcript_1725/g.4434 Transcript_1725/m.4434 type:complete len:89 (+) Transcript_1725:667-933(+)